jgi:zinc and cadmium transporter
LTEIGLAALAGAAFTVVALLGAARTAPGPRLRSVAAGVAAGILLALAFAELFPEALERAGHESAAIGFMAGFVALFAVEAVTKGHTHHGQDVVERAHLARHSLGPFVIGLGIHNFADGFSIAAGAEVSGAVGAGVAIGVLVHQLPVGVSFAAVLLALGSSRTFVVRTALGLGLLIPIGASIVAALPAPGDAAVGAILGAASGALVYIGAGHLLPEAQSERSTLTVAAVFPLALLATTLLFLALLPHE